ncbi:CBL-interacting protein kinase 5-like isoform X2 [Trifolium pratense]|uniref:CBL-interacting protein kinase 5-like isoform X2 n=1 Tax=Trifolium pratense TaxID=57577 RepID=UPI001E696134|nr:CBL-interacting protein kinase 5-like isoform X2 [Trifolium pratense]
MEKKATILMEKYEVGRMIGQGNFAKVYHARNLKTGQNVAIKVCNKEMIMRVGMKEQMKREISVMHLVRHPNIVEFYDVMASKTKIYFAMEYVKGGELFNKVSRGKLREDMARKYFQQLIEAVNHCHKRGVYHRDLKLENLLLDENGDLKVSDFGLSALLESKKKDGLLHTTCGTPAYVAPEVIRQKGYDGAMADIWSCGIILYVLLAGYLPFNDKNLMEMYKKIAKAEFKFPQWFRSDAKRLIYRILDPDPRTRITINNIMQNSWFQKGYKQIEGPKLPPISLTPMSVKDHEDYAMKPYCFNAFDIISLTSGFDLSGLFEKDMSERQHARFATKKPPSIVVSKLEEIAQLDGRFKVKKQNGIVRLEGNETGINEQLSIDTEIFEVSSSVYIVEVNKIVGDMLEYRNFWNQLLKPSLNEIVWVWQEYE